MFFAISKNYSYIPKPKLKKGTVYQEKLFKVTIKGGEAQIF